MLITNRRALRASYPEELKQILSMEFAAQARTLLSHWGSLIASVTPLWDLPDAAARLGVARLAIKDESVRSPLGSFKAVGSPIALLRLIMRRWPTLTADPKGLIDGQYRAMLADFTVISATDGNHGKALAAAAQAVGCRCMIVLHANVSVEREAAIAAYGAQIIRISGNYDASVEEAARLAQKNGWHIVSDTSYEGYEVIPRDVMQGYGAIAAEIVEQSAGQSGPTAFTHVFLQGGCGGFAAGIAGYLWEVFGSDRPRFIVVEPQEADCLYQSAVAGRAAKATGSIDSVMAGLACGETSILAWKILDRCIDEFMTISDQDAIEAMRTLAAGSEADPPLVVGESGTAGYAGLSVLLQDAQTARAAGLNRESRVLVISTEGATAPALYQELVGETAEAVLARQRHWLVKKSQ